MTNISITIIMPAKNAGKYIDECLSSIRRQTFPFWELMVVNDSSSDQTESIIKEHAIEDERIKLLQNQGDGIVPALKLAFEHAQGEYITRMDADDIMPKGRLKVMFEALQSAPQKTVITGLVKYFGEEVVSEGYQKYETWLNERVLQNDYWDWVYRECVIASPNWMVRKAALKEIGGFDLSYPEDYHLTLKWQLHGFQVIGIPEITLLWREHPERISRNSERYQQESFFRLKVAHFIKYELKRQPLVLWGTGIKGRLTAQLLDKHQTPFIWMDQHPEKYKAGIKGHAIKHFPSIESMSHFSLLISIFPNGQEFTKLTDYLHHLSADIGSDYWFL